MQQPRPSAATRVFVALPLVVAVQATLDMRVADGAGQRIGCVRARPRGQVQQALNHLLHLFARQHAGADIPTFVVHAV